MIKKKQYYAHYNAKFYKSGQFNHSHIIELTFNEWLNLYNNDKQHWFTSKQFINNFHTFAYNPIYSKAVGANSREIIYEDFLIIFSSFKDYKKYIKFINNFSIENNEEKEFLKEIMKMPQKIDIIEENKILSLRVKAITRGI